MGVGTGRGEKKEKKKKKGSSCGVSRLPAKNVLVLQQYQLHDLVLVHHVDRHVPGLCFRPQQRGAEHDGHTLRGHTVLFTVVDHPAGEEEEES